MALELLQFTFQSFWHFVGVWLLVGIPFKFVFKMWNRFFRHMSIRIHGWPPAHCDADGDFKIEV